VLTALITGANRGLGLETARQLAAQGYRIILTSRDPAKGQAALEQLRAPGRDLHYHPLDITDAESVQAARAWAIRAFERVDVLVNNAAVLLDEDEPVLSVPLEKVRATFETNLLGAWRMCQAFVPLMQAQGYGRVVNVSSEMGQWAWLTGDTSAYRLSKLALNGLTAMLAQAVTGSEVLINACCPGWVRTDMGGPHADLSVAEGAETIVWLATLPAAGPHGGFFQHRQALDW
jgi:NAD(P)-dependent dehydrogenase (short-subunit alcohol dehydrogenase family)